MAKNKNKDKINPLDIPGQRPKVLLIDPEIKKLLRPLTQEEYDLLEQSILKYGCKVPLFLWLNSGKGLDDTILLDGHHRYEICHKHTIRFCTTGLDFNSREDAVEWVKKNQLSRRNLSDEAKEYLMGSLHDEKKKNDLDNLKQNFPVSHCDSPVEEKSMRTSEKLAKEFGVSSSTIQRAAKYAEAVDTLKDTYGQEVKNKLLSGETKIPRKQVVEIAKMKPEKQKEEVRKILDDKPAEKKFISAIVPKGKPIEKVKERSKEILTVPKDLKAISKMLLENFNLEELRELVEMVMMEIK